MHTQHGPRRGGSRGPPERPSKAPPRARSASLEGSRPPRTRSASLEGPRLPRAGSASLEVPSRAHLPSSRDFAGSNRDVRPAGASSPSLSILCGHPRPCCATPATAPRTDRRQRLPRARLKMPRSTTAPLPSKLFLFEHRTRHNAVTGARFTRTAVNSTALYAMPPHVAK
jgi:hypothetical protein